jgi:hypothetical protein
MNVGGQTVHSFFHLRPGDLRWQEPEYESSDFSTVQFASHIIFDEGFMIRSDMFDKVDSLMRRLTGKDEPMGGKPIVLFGDPFQIEPVVRDEDYEQIAQYKSHYVFDSNIFREMDPVSYELQHIFRQDDPEFKDALNRARVGDSSGISLFNTRVEPRAWNTLTISLTNRGAEFINNASMDQIPTEERIYTGGVYGNFYPELPVPQILKLRVGARVMISANQNGCVNGDIGIVTRMSDDRVSVLIDRGYEVDVEMNSWERIRYEADPETGIMERLVVGAYYQIPLKPAWAITTHKSQGQTFPSAHMLLERRSFSNGQTYVGLSRVKTLEGLSLERPLNPTDFKVSHRVLKWAETLKTAVPQDCGIINA